MRETKFSDQSCIYDDIDKGTVIFPQMAFLQQAEARINRYRMQFRAYDVETDVYVPGHKDIFV